MGGVIAVAILVLLIGVGVAYQSWLRKGVQPRAFRTSRSEAEVRALFERKVAGVGWTVVDSDNPMVAQSPLLAGRRQQIALQITPAGNGLDLRIGVTRLWTKGIARVPYKAHTLRMRMNAFEKAVRSGDAVPTAPRPAPIPTHTATLPSAGPAGGVPGAVMGPNPFTSPMQTATLPVVPASVVPVASPSAAVAPTPVPAVPLATTSSPLPTSPAVPPPYVAPATPPPFVAPAAAGTTDAAGWWGGADVQPPSTPSPPPAPPAPPAPAAPAAPAAEPAAWWSND